MKQLCVTKKSLEVEPALIMTARVALPERQSRTFPSGWYVIRWAERNNMGNPIIGCERLDCRQESFRLVPFCL